MIINETPYANSLFEQPWWLNIVAQGKWNEVYSKDKNGIIIGRLPYVFQNKRIYMPKLTQNIGIWIDPKFKHDYGTQKNIIIDLVKQLPESKDCTICLSPNNEYILPFKWLGFSYEPSFTYRICDLTNIDEIYKKFNKTVKKNIKYAKNKVNVVDDFNFDNLWELQNKTYENQNRSNPLDKELLKRITNFSIETKHGKYFEAKDTEGNLHASVFLVFDKQVCYYLIGGSDIKYRSSGAQSLLLWESIKFAAQKSQVFDFEGSNIEGIENFFRQFGGICVPLYLVKKSSLMNQFWEILKPSIKRLLGYKM